MKKPLEITVFSGIAIVVHIALFASAPRDGVEAGGVGGEYLVSMQAADQTVLEMVEEWERPPEVVEDRAEIETPEDVTPNVTLPLITPPEAPRSAIQLAMATPERDRPEEMDTESVAPPPPPESESETEPEPKPDPVPEPAADAEAMDKPMRRPERLEPVEENAKVAEVESAAQSEQKAAGAGGAPVAGNRGSASTSTVSQGEIAKLTAVWGGQIRSRIERRKRYPSGRRENASLEIFVAVHNSGKLMDVGIVRSSGIAEFDHAAVRAVQRAGKFTGAPDGLEKPQYRFTLRMDFAQ